MFEMKPRIPTNRKNLKSLQSARQAQQHSALHDNQGPTNTKQQFAFPSHLKRPVPVIAHDGPLLFELVAFGYCTFALLLQYLHLYKSVWWLPHSYNDYALHFYLIDRQLIAFCLLILIRRFVWTLEKKMITTILPVKWQAATIIIARSLNTFIILMTLLCLAFNIVQNHPLVNVLYLTYPATLYFLLFGLSGEQFLELIPASPIGKIQIVVDKQGHYQTTGPSAVPFLQLVNPQSPTAGAPPVSPPPNQPSSIQPGLIRQEVAVLKMDFNSRLGQILFNSIVSAYYGAVIPCLFAQSSLHFDTAWVGRHALLVGVGAFVLYVVYCFPSSYVLMMNRTALLLGQWVKMDVRLVPDLCPSWNSGQMLAKGTTVRYGRDLYKAEGETNCAEPGNTSQSRFYSLFREPSMILSILLVVQGGLVMAQHISLTWSTQWYQLLSEGIMLFSNYYALFKVLRDYIVYWRFFCPDGDVKQSVDGEGVHRHRD